MYLKIKVIVDYKQEKIEKLKDDFVTGFFVSCNRYLTNDIIGNGGIRGNYGLGSKMAVPQSENEK